MVICKDLEYMQHFDASVLTIGSLDGMHRGHTEIISELKGISIAHNVPSVVITFDPHPKSVIHPLDQSIQLLISSDKKMEYLDNYAVDYVWIIPFDKDFSKVSAGKFLKKYISEYFNPLDIVIGYDHHFGFKREGNEDFLNKNTKKYSYKIHKKEPILYDDLPISSSRIRSYINKGNIEEANECLGRKYEFSGTIVKGQGRGTQLKFPTANIQPHISNQLIPRRGVYCVDAIIEDSCYTGMCNIGNRPTFYENGESIIEVHLLSNDAMNLYEKDIVIKFKKYLREERKYESSSALTEQLEIDRQACFAT